MSARSIAPILGVAVAMTWTLLSPVIVTHAATAGPCPDVEVTFARGTDEPPGVGSVGQAFIDSLRSQVAGRSVGVYAVNYPATDDFARSLEAGGADAHAHVQSMVATCPATKMVVGGYSQGAAVIGMATNDLAQAADHVAAVAFFGNPESVSARRMIGGELPTISALYGAKTIDLCVPGDPICSEGKDARAHVLYVQAGMTSQAAAFAAGRL